MMKKIFIFLISLTILSIPVKIMATDIGLTLEVTIFNPEGPTYYTWIRIKELAGWNKVEVLRDGTNIETEEEGRLIPTSYTDKTGEKKLLLSDTYPPEGKHTYKVTVYDSAGAVLGSSSAEATVPSGSYNPPAAGGSGVVTEFGNTDFGQYLSKILTWLVTIVASLATLMFIYAGYIYVTSQGNPEGVSQAKDIIIGVITGIVLLFLIEIILVKTVGIKWEYL